MASGVVVELDHGLSPRRAGPHHPGARSTGAAGSAAGSPLLPGAAGTYPPSWTHRPHRPAPRRPPRLGAVLDHRGDPRAGAGEPHGSPSTCGASSRSRRPGLCCPTRTSPTRSRRAVLVRDGRGRRRTRPARGAAGPGRDRARHRQPRAGPAHRARGVLAPRCDRARAAGERRRHVRCAPTRTARRGPCDVLVTHRTDGRPLHDRPPSVRRSHGHFEPPDIPQSTRRSRGHASRPSTRHVQPARAHGRRDHDR
jgi:hypothetical protein